MLKKIDSRRIKLLKEYFPSLFESKREKQFKRKYFSPI